VHAAARLRTTARSTTARSNDTSGRSAALRSRPRPAHERACWTCWRRPSCHRRRPKRLRDAHARFVTAAEEGRAPNKHGRRYKRSAWEDIDECLRKHVLPKLGSRRLTDVRRSEVPRLVDDLARKLSGSRVRSVVNALRSLYRWAQDRELVAHDPAAQVRLPAMNATRRERVATPAEFAALLGALEIEDALPYALAGYAMGRRAQIQRLRWREVDLRVRAIERGVDDDARKSRGARRVVPAVKPLLSLLKRAWISQGRPLGRPPRMSSSPAESQPPVGHRRPLGPSGCCVEAPQPAGDRITRVSPHRRDLARRCRGIVEGSLRAHGTRDPGSRASAAPITLAGYTHLMPDAIENARAQLDSWLAAETAKDVKTG
jgi:hypothetical protein